MKFLQVERINFYSMTGQILYSNEKSLVGVDVSEVTMIQQALKGDLPHPSGPANESPMWLAAMGGG